jgi:PRTRC genetic system protein C
MALQVLDIERTFSFTKGEKTVELKDPNPTMSPEEVVKFYSGTHPELTTAKLSGPKVNGNKAEYTLDVTVGTKG